MLRFFLNSVFALFLMVGVGVAAGPPHLPVQRDMSSAVLQAEMPDAEAPRNIIFFLGDGMGPEHIRATTMFLGRDLVFESFPYHSMMTTDSTDGLTDSAAGATAMATGHRVGNGVISMAIPGNGEELPTVLEMWQEEGASVGLLTTSAVNDASPAAFGAHEPTRDNKVEIAKDYFQDSRPNVLMGAADDGVSESMAEASGYTVVVDATEMLALDASSETHVAGLFGEDKMPPIEHGRRELPSMAQMTETALDLLDDDADGFFLFIEQEGTDSYSHGNDLELMVNAVIELEEAVNVALDWAGEEGDTLIVVTSDHETGGLEIRKDNGVGELPDVSWTAGSRHTELPVPIYARGPRAAWAPLVEDITQVFTMLEPEELDHKVMLPFAGWWHGR